MIEYFHSKRQQMYENVVEKYNGIRFSLKSQCKNERYSYFLLSIAGTQGFYPNCYTTQPPTTPAPQCPRGMRDEQ